MASKEQTETAIANVRSLGSKASDADRALTTKASQQKGIRGSQALDALGKNH